MTRMKWFGGAESTESVPDRLKGADMIIRTSGGPIVVEIKSFSGKRETEETIARLLGTMTEPAPKGEARRPRRTETSRLAARLS